MKTGQMIKLRGYGGEELIRYVVRQEGNTLIVCRPEEFDLAQAQKREPNCVGFNIKYLVEEKQVRAQPHASRQNE